jgi:hypothetical protein
VERRVPMGILTIERSPREWPTQVREGCDRKRIAHRTLRGFTALMTLGIALAGLILMGLFAADRNGRVAVVLACASAIVAFWAVMLFVAWLLLLFRSLVAIVEIGLAMRTRWAPRKKIGASGISTGVADAWLDGAV